MASQNDCCTCVSDVLNPPFTDIFTYEMFNEMQSALLEQVLNTDTNMVVSAPTGSGKTVIHELAIVRLLSQRPANDIKCVFIAPNKALCQQRTVEWTASFGKLGLNVVEMTGDSMHENSLKVVAKASIIITTPEKWDALTRSWRKHVYLLGIVDILLLDEVHHLNEDRGATLEIIVGRMRTLNEMYQAKMHEEGKDSSLVHRLRILALSACLPNVSDIGEWLSCTSQSTHYFDDSYRPIPLTTHTLAFGSTRNPFLFERSLDDRVPDIINRYSGGKQTLIFCASKHGCENLCSMLSKRMNRHGPSAALMTATSSVQDPNLKSVLLLGYGYHHAGLPADDRTIVEELYLNRHIHVLCTTSTLAHGINLPARLVIVKGTNQWRGGARGYEKMPRSAIMQMCGRAGRPGLDTEGVAVIMTSSEDKEFYEDIVQMEVIESSLPSVLIEALCAEITQTVIQDIADAILWLKHTFFYVRVRKNPAKYGFDVSLNEQQLESKLRDLCISSVKDLASAGIVSFDESGFISALPEAFHMTKHLVRFHTMQNIMGMEHENASIAKLLQDISMAQELHKPVRRSDKKILNELMRLTRFPLKIRVTEPCHKAYVLLQIAVSCRQLVNDFSLRVEMSEIAEQCLRLLSAVYDYSNDRGKGRLLATCILLQRALRFRLWEDGSTSGQHSSSLLEQCREIPSSIAHRLADNGIIEPYDVINARPNVTQSKLNCSTEDIKALISFVNRMLRSQVAIKTTVEDDSLKVTITPVSLIPNQEISLEKTTKYEVISYTVNTGLMLLHRTLDYTLSPERDYSISVPYTCCPPENIETVVLAVDIVGIDAKHMLNSTNTLNAGKAPSIVGDDDDFETTHATTRKKVIDNSTKRKKRKNKTSENIWKKFEYTKPDDDTNLHSTSMFPSSSEVWTSEQPELQRLPRSLDFDVTPENGSKNRIPNVSDGCNIGATRNSEKNNSSKHQFNGPSQELTLVRRKADELNLNTLPVKRLRSKQFADSEKSAQFARNRLVQTQQMNTMTSGHVAFPYHASTDNSFTSLPKNVLSSPAVADSFQYSNGINSSVHGMNDDDYASRSAILNDTEYEGSTGLVNHAVGKSDWYAHPHHASRYVETNRFQHEHSLNDVQHQHQSSPHDTTVPFLTRKYQPKSSSPTQGLSFFSSTRNKSMQRHPEEKIEEIKAKENNDIAGTRMSAIRRLATMDNRTETPFARMPITHQDTNPTTVFNQHSRAKESPTRSINELFELAFE